MIGSLAEINEDQYVLLIDEKNKYYMLIYSDFIKNGYEDDVLKFISEKEHRKMVDELEKSGYSMLSYYSSEFYFDE